MSPNIVKFLKSIEELFDALNTTADIAPDVALDCPKYSGTLSWYKSIVEPLMLPLKFKVSSEEYPPIRLLLGDNNLPPFNENNVSAPPSPENIKFK